MLLISTHVALLLYLALTLGAVLSIWLYQHYRHQNERARPTEQRLHTCEFCHYSYLELDHHKVTQCPQCKSFNQSNNHRTS